MRIASYLQGGAWRSGLVLDDSIVDSSAAASLAGWDQRDVAAAVSNRALLAQPIDRLRSLLETAASNLDPLGARGAVHSLGEVRLGPPILDPSKIICIGLNYRDHAEEVGAAAPASPMFFAKFANSLVGPTDDIEPPIDTAQVDYEAELAVVIGRPGRYIAADDALSHVVAVMAFNDVSARDLQLANGLWTGGKAVDTFGPCGPWLVTIDEFDDIQQLGLRTRVNGVTVQDGTTSNMIFGVADTIAFLSRIMTLEVGDVIATGTPAGVRKAHGPGTYLLTGDVVEVEVEGVGVLRNTVVAPRSLSAT